MRFEAQVEKVLWTMTPEPLSPERIRLQTLHMLRIRKFMKLAGQEIPGAPEIPAEHIRILRARLILEEAFETVEALGVNVRIGTEPGHWSQDQIPISKWLRSGCLLSYDTATSVIPNLKDIVDGCADISVVTIGTLLACGVHDVAVLEEVDKNNLAKFGPGGYRDDGGKWVKPPDHAPPRIREILDLQTAAAVSERFPAGETFEDEFGEIKEAAEDE